MRICIIGKFPPIQGGVSMRTYWTAHGLARRGHDVHVVTNAKEARPPFRTFMRGEDWDRCVGSYGAGSVVVHWSDPVDRSQSYIPMASPFVSKLASIAARVHSERPFDVIYSHYLEPYGVAGHLAAQMTGLPHVVRMAGSDAGRLWRHPQLEALYDHILQSAEAVVAVGTVAERAVQRGVASNRITPGGVFVVPEDLFTPDGEKLNLALLRAQVEQDPDFRDLLWGEFSGDRPYFGVYGKLGERKGSFVLLAAMEQLKRAGHEVGLVALAHGDHAIQESFREQARRFGLTDRILQIPFLPHWRVPQFLRGCLAVCCLEQDFPIAVHAPVIPREVLMAGACLVASTELIRKLPAHERLPHGYGCVAVEDVNNVESLADKLAAIAQHPAAAAAIGGRGRVFALEMQKGMTLVHMPERILEAASKRRTPSTAGRPAGAVTVNETGQRFFLTAMVAEALLASGEIPGKNGGAPTERQDIDVAFAREILAAVEQHSGDGKMNARAMSLAVRTEIAIATAEDEADQAAELTSDPIFRLHLQRWALEDSMLSGLVPVRNRRLVVLEFDHDVSEFLGACSIADFPVAPAPRRSHIAVFAPAGAHRRDPLLIDAMTAQILHLSDGTRTAMEIAQELSKDPERSDIGETITWIENLFVLDLVSLQDTRLHPHDKALPDIASPSIRGLNLE